MTTGRGPQQGEAAELAELMADFRAIQNNVSAYEAFCENRKSVLAEFAEIESLN